MGGISVDERGQQAAGPDAVVDLDEVVRMAVDVFDATAQLESQGYGDAVARRHGFTDTFEMADLLFGAAPPLRERPSSSQLATAMIWAWGRMVVLVSGVLLSLASLPQQADPQLVFVAGAAGWIWAQATSAGVWQGLGTGHRKVAATIAVTSAPVLAVLALAVSLVAHSYAPLLWALWGMASSVLVILRPGARVVLFVAVGAVLTVIVSAVSHTAGVVTACTVIVAACLGAAAVLRAEGGVIHRPSRAAVATQCMGVMQAAGQVTVFGVVLVLVGSDAFTAVAVAGLVAGATADPILELAYSGARRVVALPTSWQAGRRITALLGVVGVLLVVLVAACTAVAVRTWLSPHTALLAIVLAACMVAGVTAGTGLLLRAGSTAGAMVLALTFAVLSLIALTLHYFDSQADTATVLLLPTVQSVALALSLGALLIPAVLAARCLSHPSAW